MNMLVLGGSRFIGLHLVRLLSDQSHKVTVLNRGSTQAELPEGVARLSADRTDPSQVRAALKGASFDAAFDISGYTPSSLQPVIESLDGRVGHFAFCSTTLVYAPSDTMPIEEDSPLYRSPDASQYSRDKILCEDALMEAFDRRGFPTTILRPSYVYGPDNYIQAREFSYFMRLTHRRQIIMPGDGNALIHPIHVDDLAAAFAATAGRSHTLGQAYTTCGPEAITANGYVRVIGEAMGVVPEIAHAAPSDYLALPSEQQVFPYEWRESNVYSIEKARRDLDWSPRYQMGNGMAMTYDWWLNLGLDTEEWDFFHEDVALATITRRAGS